MNPLVSICIPCFNFEKTIVQAIESAISQTYDNIEIIIVDDCSSDNSYEIVKNISDSRIKLYKNEKNLGMSQNWNKCVTYASGEYVHFLHGDDILLSDSINKKVNAAVSNDNIVLVFCATEIINSDNKTLMIRRYKNKDVMIEGKKIAYESLFKRNIYGEPSNVLFRRDAFNVVGGFCTSLKYATDWDLWLEISSIGNVYYINSVLSKYRVSNSNVTSSLKLKDMMKDDRMMIDNLKRINGMHLPFYVVFIHRFVIRMRNILRFIYMKYFAAN